MSTRKKVLLLVVAIALFAFCANLSMGQGKDKPFGPKQLRVVDYGEDRVTLRWQDKANNEDGFDVYYKGPGEEHILRVSGVSPGNDKEKEYTVTGLEPSEWYLFKVRAYNSTGYSAWSNDVKIKTKGEDNKPPFANCKEEAIYPTWGPPLLRVYFDLSKSYDPDGILTKAIIAFGDGEEIEVTDGALKSILVHEYANGTYHAKITVWDDDGAKNSCTAIITVSDRPDPYCKLDGTIEASALLSEYIKPDKKKLAKVTVQWTQEKPNGNGYWVLYRAIYSEGEWEDKYWPKKNQWLFTLDDLKPMLLVAGKDKEFPGKILKHRLEETFAPSNKERKIMYVWMWACHSCDPKLGQPYGVLRVTIPAKYPLK